VDPSAAGESEGPEKNPALERGERSAPKRKKTNNGGRREIHRGARPDRGEFIKASTYQEKGKYPKPSR